MEKQQTNVIELVSAKVTHITTYNEAVNKLRNVYGRCGPALALIALAEVIRDDQSFHARRLSPVLDSVLNNIFIDEA